jgi:FlaA1/EpsC-like NDP-sugar epimerase
LSYIKEYPIYERDYVLKKIEDVYSMSKLNLNIDERPEIILGIIEGAFSDIGEGVAIWGVGKWGMKLYGLLEKCSIPIIYFLDNNKCKCGQRINGVKVKNPENLKNEETRTNIIIAVRYFGDEVSKQLEAYGNQNIRWITLDEIASENVGIDCNEEN